MKVSPTQIGTRRICPRRWGLGDRRLPGGVKPPQARSAADGEAVHAELEAVSEKGTAPRTGAAKAAAAAGHAPFPGQWVALETQVVVPENMVAPGVILRGKLDAAVLEDVPIGFDGRRTFKHQLVVIDHKTTSDLKWAKTREQLFDDPQVLVYGVGGLEKFAHLGVRTDRVKASWRYVTRRKPHRTARREVVLDLDSPSFRASWMQVVADATAIRDDVLRQVDPLTLPIDPSGCDVFGGCPHHPGKGGRCNVSPVAAATALFAVGINQVTASGGATEEVKMTDQQQQQQQGGSVMDRLNNLIGGAQQAIDQSGAQAQQASPQQLQQAQPQQAGGFAFQQQGQPLAQPPPPQQPPPQQAQPAGGFAFQQPPPQQQQQQQEQQEQQAGGFAFQQAQPQQPPPQQHPPQQVQQPTPGASLAQQPGTAPPPEPEKKPKRRSDKAPFGVTAYVGCAPTKGRRKDVVELESLVRSLEEAFGGPFDLTDGQEHFVQRKARFRQALAVKLQENGDKGLEIVIDPSTLIGREFRDVVTAAAERVIVAAS